MPINVTCECGHVIVVPGYMQNRSTKCPNCNRDIFIPPSPESTHEDRINEDVCGSCGAINSLEFGRMSEAWFPGSTWNPFKYIRITGQRCVRCGHLELYAK